MDVNATEKIRSHFIRAAKEFHFTFVSPYILDEEKGLCAFGLVLEYASENGAIIELVEPPHYEPNDAVIEWCKKHNRWYSQLSTEPLLLEYNSEYFREMLEDWKI